MPAIPPAGATTTTLQVMSYNPLTDAHTLVLDLNDGTHYRLHQSSLKIPQPKKAEARSSNLRTQGERIVKWQYQNRHITCSLFLVDYTPNDPNATTTLLTSIRNLLSAIENPPYELRIALPRATNYSYADVVHVKHNIPSDPIELLAGAIRHVQIDFECLPGLRGDRVTLQNLVDNPGFEAPGGPAVQVFYDTFANVNAYSVLSGSAPSVASNVMTIPSAGIVGFGSPAWGAVNLWQVRFQWITGLVGVFALHYTDINNRLDAVADGTNFKIEQVIAATTHTLATTAAALTNTNFYWLQVTQFPAASGTAPYIKATLYNDSAGAIGTQVATVASTTNDAVTALSGKPAIWANGAALKIGGNFVNVHLLELFGPGGWICSNTASGSTGVVSGAWDGTRLDSGMSGTATAGTQTYGGGPVTSFGAARLDLPPAGTVNGWWDPYNGGTPAGTQAMPIQTAGDVVSVSAWMKSSGLAGTCTTSMYLREFNSSGTFLRQTQLNPLTGNQAVWTQLSGTVTTGANCAYADVLLNAVDGTAGSANGTVWFDNVLIYDQTSTGLTAMPYCEMRFPQGPAQIMVSGVVGDMPSPAMVGLGTLLPGPSWTNDSLLVYVGRRALSTVGAQFIATSNNGPLALVLDPNSYGGWYQSNSNDALIILQTGVSYPSVATAQGTYHILARLQTAQTSGFWKYLTVQAQVSEYTFVANFAGAAPYQAQALTPFSATAQWQVLDLGQIPIPCSPAGAMQDQSAVVVVPPQLYVTDTANSHGGSNQSLFAGWMAMLPVDGDLFIGTYNNTSSGPSFTNNYLWLFIDGLRSGLGSPASWTFSGAQTTPLPSPNLAVGAQGTASSTAPSFNSYSDPYLTLDPTSATGLTGVNQIVAGIFDTKQAQGALAILSQIAYSPLYLFPR